MSSLNLFRGTIYMVFPYMDYDLSGILANRNITLKPFHIKSYMQQLLLGLEYMHSKEIFHRDLKCANILINEDGELKVNHMNLFQLADFGLAKDMKGEDVMTANVCTLWYRAPELVFHTGARTCKYTAAIDMWGAGCIFGEMWLRCPLFIAKTEVDLLTKILTLIGSPKDSGKDYWMELPLFKDGIVKDLGHFKNTVGDKFPSSK
jgi:serine/threonine-protein kinase BUR1